MVESGFIMLNKVSEALHRPGFSFVCVTRLNYIHETCHLKQMDVITIFIFPPQGISEV